MQLRSLDREWLARVDAYWGQLLPLVAPFTASRGGPVLMVQVRLLTYHLSDQACFTDSAACADACAALSQMVRMPPWSWLSAQRSCPACRT